MFYTVKPQYFMLQRVYVGSHVDNIDVDRTTGNLWIGSHYVLHGKTPVFYVTESVCWFPC